IPPAMSLPRRAMKLRREERCATTRVSPSTILSIVVPVSRPVRRRRRFVPGPQVILNGRDTHLLGLDYALKMLASVNQPLAGDAPFLADQHCVRKLAHSVGHPEFAGQHHRK